MIYDSLHLNNHNYSQITDVSEFKVVKTWRLSSGTAYPLIYYQGFTLMFLADVVLPKRLQIKS